MIKVYHGFGTDGHMALFGHVFLRSPLRQEKFSSRFLKNVWSLLRLFVIKPYRDARIFLQWQGRQIRAVTDETGFFQLRWQPETPVQEGWHAVTVHLEGHDGITGQGALLVPHPGDYAIVSDIDDTFLVSHSAHIARRLFVLLTRNARTRKPFDAVARHYRLLAAGNGQPEPRPFFYVSSSEWNLYDYIRDFSKQYQFPEGVYLLSRIKQLHQFWKTGKGKHSAKYFRIARLLLTYPEKRFVLMGDDSQDDPAIYLRLVSDFPDRIVCVYLRHVRHERLAATRLMETAIRKAGVEICYFTHSETAITHSYSTGLIKSIQ